MTPQQKNPQYRTYTETIAAAKKKKNENGYSQASKQQLSEHKLKRRLDDVLDSRRLKEGDLL